MDLQISEQINPQKILIITLDGRLNALSALDLKTIIKKRVESGSTKIVLDMSKVTFIDSSGMAALVAGLKSVRQVDGMLKLCGLSEQASMVLKITMLDRIFEIYANDVEALQSMPN